MEKRALLIVLDGFGIGKKSPFNSIQNAKMPFYHHLLETYPHSEILTHGEAVGLPPGIMGNSEVGHMTLGAGRIIYQDLTRISKSIDQGDFFKNEKLIKTLKTGAEKTGRVHLIGLLSDGGVHSHIQHLMSLLDLCEQLKIPQVSVHAFLDGRDTPPDSACDYLNRLLSHPTFHLNSKNTKTTLASLMGRYWAMDRDQRWDRIEKAYLAMTGQISITPIDPFQYVQNSYLLGKTDEFIEPICFSEKDSFQTGDSVIFFNYRSDRARQLSHVILNTPLHQINRGKDFIPSSFATFTQYDEKLKSEIIFSPQNFNHIFGEWLEKYHLKQLRIAETEKYAHVTFFFNGGRENPFQNENRILVSSPRDIPTYDLKPEMSAIQVAHEATQKILLKEHHFILINFANADMVGHTGNYNAAIQAMEILDSCLSQVIQAAQQSDFDILVTADHGNAEEMQDIQGRMHTQHTLNPVPLLWIYPNNNNQKNKKLRSGTLADIMPTLCQLLELPIPKEVTGKSLIETI